MKLFITNKNDFEESVHDSKSVHQRAYNILESSLAQGNIPVEIWANRTNDPDDWIEVTFLFIQIRKDVYFYEFTGVIS